MIERFRLLRATGGVCRFAAVTVNVAPAVAHNVVIAPDVGCSRGHRLEAVAGARHALNRLPAGGFTVTVTDIQTTAADTGIGDVHEASTRAVWQATGVMPQPTYVGFSEPDVVAAWLRDRIGHTVTAVTEARHRHRDERDHDGVGLVHAWLHFEYGPPTMLHSHGDQLLLSTSNPYSSCGMDDAADVRVGPATAPDHLAGLVGKRLTNAALIVQAVPPPSCSGLLLQMADAELVIATLDDEWILTTGRLPTRAEPHLRLGPWIM